MIEVHADVESANTAAVTHAKKEIKKVPFGDQEYEESYNNDGGHEIYGRTFEDRRDNFIVSVKKMELKGASSKAPAKVKRPLTAVYVLSQVDVRLLR